MTVFIEPFSNYTGAYQTNVDSFKTNDATLIYGYIQLLR